MMYELMHAYLTIMVPVVVVLMVAAVLVNAFERWIGR